MKLKTAVATAHTVAARIRHACGIIGTPHAQHEAFRVRRAWVFGSTAKGNPSPHDVDILIEGIRVGRRQTTAKIARRNLSGYALPGNAKMMKPMRMGIPLPVDTQLEAFRWIRKNLKMVRLHAHEIDGLIAHPRILIYPKNTLTLETAQAMHRPQITAEIIQTAAAQLAQQQKWTEEQAEDIVQAYGPGMDGYQLARELDDRHGWEINRQEVEALDEMEHIVRELHRQAGWKWVNDNDIKPPFPIGTHLVQGEITGLSDYLPAYYQVCAPQETGNTRLLIRFEDARLDPNRPEAQNPVFSCP